MKETDYSIIQTAVQVALTQYPYEIKDILDTATLVAIVTNIYLNADTSKAVTNHVDNVCTIIATQDKVSVIWEETSSYIKTPGPFVLYKDLTEDIVSILECIDCCVINILDR